MYSIRKALKHIPSGDPKTEVFLLVMGKQQVQPDLPSPLFCILRKSPIVRSQKFLHTPKEKNIQ